MSRTPILILDDDPSVTALLSQVLGARGYPSETFQDPLAALAEVGPDRHPVLLVDLMMPGMDGITFLVEARRRGSRGTPIMMTAAHDFEASVQAINRANVFRLLSKPWRNDEVVRAVSEAAIEDGLRRGQERLWLHAQLREEEAETLRRALEIARSSRLSWLADVLAEAVSRRAPGTAWRARREVRVILDLAAGSSLPPEVVEAAVLAARLAAVAELSTETGSREVALRLLEALEVPPEVQRVLAEQDERWDGTGACGLAGEEIHPAARLLSAARQFVEAEQLGELEALPGQARAGAADPALVPAIERAIEQRF